MLFRDFRPIDSGPGPGSDVPGRVHVRMVGVSTDHAAELGLRWTVGFGDVSASRTFPARIARINDDDFHACLPCLVFDKGTKLMERPAAHLRPLPLAKPCPVAEALEVFEGNPAPSAFSLGNERFGNDVVDVPAKARLMPRKGFELAPDGFGAKSTALATGCCLLERPALVVQTHAARLDAFPGVPIAIAVRGDVRHAEIDAQKVRRRCLGAFWQINGHEQEPFAVLAAHKITLPLGSRKTFGLVAAHDDRHQDTTGECQQRHAIDAPKAHQALIVRDGCERAKARALGFVPLVSLADLRNAAHGHLRRQAEAFAQGGVIELLQRDLVGRFPGKRFSCQPVRCRVEGAYCRFKRGGLLWRRQKLCLQG